MNLRDSESTIKAKQLFVEASKRRDLRKAKEADMKVLNTISSFYNTYNISNPTQMRNLNDRMTKK